MEIAAIALGFLSVVLGLSSIGAGIYISKRTDRLIQTEDERAKSLISDTQKMIEKMDERTENLIADTQKMIEEGRRQTQQLIAKIDERIERMDERIEKMDERTEKMDERWHQTINYIASLIKSEGEKTKELISQVIK